MADEQQAKETSGSRRRTGPKPFPVLPIESVLPLAATILREGLSGELRRLTLFDRLNRSPDSGTSRQLVTLSSRYGLTTGGYQAETISLTEAGRAIASEAPSFPHTRKILFNCAIDQFPPFQQLYDKLRNQRVPAEDVLRNELRKLGINTTDCRLAADVFLENARYVGLVREVSGNERVIPIDQVLEESALSGEGCSEQSEVPQRDLESPVAVAPVGDSTAGGPSLHIDVQVHIDSSATSEQIDQIFASMAKHLYNKAE